MAHHILKIEHEYMLAKLTGKKEFEVRNNDRNFKVGDTVSYIDSEHGAEWGGVFEITYITDFAQKDNYVVFGERYLPGKRRGG